MFPIRRVEKQSIKEKEKLLYSALLGALRTSIFSGLETGIATVDESRTN